VSQSLAADGFMGGVWCMGSGGLFGGGGSCGTSWTNCSDNHEHGVTCSTSDWSCDCQIDGKTQKTFSSPMFCSASKQDKTSIANTQCGWMLN
jgi:hypothetical protein